MRLLRFAAAVLRMAASDLLRRPLGSVMSIAAMTVAVALLAAFLVLMQGASRAVTRWTDQATAEIFLADGTPADAIDQLARDVAGLGSVRRVERVSSARALDEFESLFPEFDDVVELVGSNPFPPSLRLTLEDPAGTGIAEVEQAVRQSAAVTGVRFDREWIDTLARVGQALAWLLLGGSALLLGAALVTVGSVVRLALDDKRDEVRLMRLVGAPVSFVVAPILVAGGLLGGVGGTAAVLAVDASRRLVVERAAEGPLAGWAELFLGAPLGPVERLLLLALALAAGAAAAGMAAGREAVR